MQGFDLFASSVSFSRYQMPFERAEPLSLDLDYLFHIHCKVKKLICIYEAILKV